MARAVERHDHTVPRGVAAPARKARPYGGKGPEARQSDRQGRLLAAGLELFGTIGFTRTTIPGICAAAGVTTRHFYDDFDDRESLLRAVYDRVIAEAREAVARALGAASDDPRERTRVSLEAFLRVYLDDPRRGRVACIEVVGTGPALERHRRAVIHEFAGVIAVEAGRSLRRAGLPDRNMHLASIALAGATNELVIEWLTLKSPPPVVDVRDELLGLFVAMIEGARPALEYVENSRP